MVIQGKGFTALNLKYLPMYLRETQTNPILLFVLNLKYLPMYLFSGGVARLRPIPYGEANETIWLSKVDCKGEESELANCKHEKFGGKG